MPVSEAFYRHRRILISLIALILVGEVLFRFFEPKISVNIRQIAMSEEIAQKILKEEKPSLLALGNSLIGDGLDLEITKILFGEKYQVLRYVPDATNIWDWYFILKHKFLSKKAIPDTILIGFAWNQISDNSPPDSSRLAKYFATLADLAEIKGFEFSGFAYSEFLVASFSEIYSSRGLLRSRFFDFFLPHYAEFAQQLNISESAQVTSSKGPKSSFKLLDSLRALIPKSTKVIFVAMPVVEPYNVSSQTIAKLAELDFLYLDARQVPGISEEFFKDSIHLKPTGSAIFSRFLVQRIQDL